MSKSHNRPLPAAKAEAAERDFAAAQEHHRTGRREEAEALYRRALAANPRHAAALQYLGAIATENRHYDTAERLIARSLALDPDDARAHYHLGEALHARGKLTEAAERFRRAIELRPDYVQAHNNLGNVLFALGNYAAAAACLERAIALAPDYAVAHTNLGNVRQMQGRLDEAALQHRRAIALQPDFAVAYNNLGRVLLDQREFEPASAAFRRALALASGYFAAHDNLLSCLNYDPTVTPEMLVAEARQYGRAFAAPRPQRYANTADPDRRLKIGYVSPDLRRHPVGYFLAPLLAGHDRTNFVIHCYYGFSQEDEVTSALRRHAKVWRSTVGVSDADLAATIRNDGIDILVDLAGHTGYNRLSVFAAKPAPVTATWLGYPATTGLPAMDWRITDAIADPPGAEAFHTEALFRLAGGFLCYRSPPDAPAVAPPPFRARGAVTFGSFNHHLKLNRAVIGVWAQILKAVPDSRLLIKGASLADAGVAARLRAEFAAEGIGGDRVELLPWIADMRGHLAAYGEVDIALDPFPYNGTTTTCEALWMGVPVVALIGDRHAGRVGFDLLSRVGLERFAAPDLGAYIRIAADLARTDAARAELRAGLRERMARSPLCDAPRFVAEFESALRAIWRRWCEAAG